MKKGIVAVLVIGLLGLVGCKSMENVTSGARSSVHIKVHDETPVKVAIMEALAEQQGVSMSTLMGEVENYMEENNCSFLDAIKMIGVKVKGQMGSISAEGVVGLEGKDPSATVKDKSIDVDWSEDKWSRDIKIIKKADGSIELYLKSNDSKDEERQIDIPEKELAEEVEKIKEQ